MTKKQEENLNEKIGKEFLNMLSTCGKAIMLKDLSNNTKKEIRALSTKKFEDLSEQEKQYHILAGYAALQHGLSLLDTLHSIKEVK